jgi:hypothetical protein
MSSGLHNDISSGWRISEVDGELRHGVNVFFFLFVANTMGSMLGFLKCFRQITGKNEYFVSNLTHLCK